MGQRRAEQGKDAITQRLRHIAVVLMHRVHHQLQGRINNRSRFFGIESFNQRRRAFEIANIAVIVLRSPLFHCALPTPLVPHGCVGQ